MAIEVITTNQTALYTIDSSDQVFMAEGVVASSSGDTFRGTNDGEMSLTILGSIFSNGNAIDLGNASADLSALTVTIGETGFVQSANAFNSVIYLRRGGDVVNNGEIIGISNAIHFGIDVTSGSVVNSGTIQSTTGTGIHADGKSDSISGVFDIFNTGQIFGSSFGIYIDDHDLELQNTGLISGNIGVLLSPNIAFTNVMNINNTGTIIGTGGSAIYSSFGDDAITNSGHIFGDVILGAGSDTYDGFGGVIEGTLDGGAGNDTLDMRGGTVTGQVRGGADDDTYIVDDATVALIEFADQGIDLVKSTVNFKLAENFENLSMIGSDDVRGTGNGEKNVITGNSGDNVLRGLGGADTLSGASGNDTLRGGKGNDKLNGGTGDDTLRGGKGNDKLTGSDGNDILIGGAGKDTLSGGVGSDQFVFNRAPHSPNTSDADTISDFELGIDRIDLSNLVAGTIGFIGSAGFSGTGAEVRVTENTGSTIIRVDVDGDGSADMKIFVDGVVGVLENDFIL